MNDNERITELEAEIKALRAFIELQNRLHCEELEGFIDLNQRSGENEKVQLFNKV